MSYGLKEIAEELNMSVSTVSRALNNTGRISPETRKKVMDTARRHNYVPNKVAQSLRQKRTKTVGLIVPDIGDYFSSVIKGVESVLYTNGYSMFLADSRENELKEANYIRLMYESQVDGLLLATVSKDFRWVENYESRGIPVIFFDNEPDDSVKCNKVLLNNIKASEIAVNHLVTGGHTKIALICGNVEESTARFRKEGFIEAMKKHNLPVDPELIKEGLYYLDVGYTSMVELINNRKEHPFTAVIVSTHTMSCSALRAIKDCGLTYPDDIAFVGFDIEDKHKLFSPSITSVLQPGEHIGEILAQNLIRKMEEADSEEGQRMEEEVSCTVINPVIKLGESSSRGLAGRGRGI